MKTVSLQGEKMLQVDRTECDTELWVVALHQFCCQSIVKYFHSCRLASIYQGHVNQVSCHKVLFCSEHC